MGAKFTITQNFFFGEKFGFFAIKFKYKRIRKMSGLFKYMFGLG